MKGRATVPEGWLPGSRGWSTSVFPIINVVDSLLEHRPPFGLSGQKARKT